MSTREVGMARNVSARANVTNDIERILSMPRCKVVQANAQAINNATNTAVTFNATADLDTDGLYNTAVTDRVTIHTQGLYDVKGHVMWPNGVGGNQRSAWIQKNGVATRYANDYAAPNAALLVALHCIDTMILFPGDYLQMFVFQDSGGVLSTSAAVGNPVELNVCLIST